MGNDPFDVGADTAVVFLVQPVVTADGEERRGDPERCGTYESAERFAAMLRNLGLGAVIWAVASTAGVIDPSSMVEIAAFIEEA
jgi:hypothetical protein